MCVGWIFVDPRLFLQLTKQYGIDTALPPPLPPAISAHQQGHPSTPPSGSGRMSPSLPGSSAQRPSSPSFDSLQSAAVQKQRGSNSGYGSGGGGFGGGGGRASFGRSRGSSSAGDRWDSSPSA